MSKTRSHTQTAFQSDDSGGDLQQALLRLTHPRYAGLKADLEDLKRQIADLIAIQEKLENTDDRNSGDIAALNDRADDLILEIDSIQAGLQTFSTQLSDLQATLRSETAAGLQEIKEDLDAVQLDLESVDAMAARLQPVLVGSIEERARDDSKGFASAISPVIGPAIRHQIRSARQDIIDALYPVIGSIISKAIAEEFRTLSRKIDSQLRQQLNFQKRLSNLLAGFRGVSAGEMLLRDALPYAIEHVFLIHQGTGLLLADVHVSGKSAADPDLIGGMLTAIGDFVKDSFGSGERALEEVTYGERRILIEGSQYAYVAVVLDGVEPPGFNHLVRAVINGINLKAENELRAFDGRMEPLPDFHPDLNLLLNPDPELLAEYSSPEALDRGQRIFLTGAVLGLLLLITGVAFSCIYAVRLWPLVFP